MGVSAAVTMDTGMFIFCACADAHIHCCVSIKWVDQGVVYPIRLSGIFSYLAWLKNKGVRIIEVLLYIEKATHCCNLENKFCRSNFQHYFVL